MLIMKKLFTSESVTEGHPDKVCDQISDAIVDECLKVDPNSRCAVETMVKNNDVYIVGEVSTKANIEYDKIARKVIEDIGYIKAEYGFDNKTCKITVDISNQSSDIAQGVDRSSKLEQGAGDQGMMFGFASDETENLMPLTIELAHNLTKKLASVRKDGTVKYLRPDGKAQVTVEYDDNGVPLRIETVVLSTQHDEGIELEDLKKDMIEYVIKPICGKYLDENTIYHINPTGNFVIGGPVGDSGLTGRKIIVDTYGGVARHGGGAFSGKDPSKVDRSAAYACRWIAKNIVAAKLAKKCEIQVAYAIGVAAPVSVFVDCFGTNLVSEEFIVDLVMKHFDLRPAMIEEKLHLTKPQYYQTAKYGHFGENTKNLQWEQTNMVEFLKKD